MFSRGEAITDGERNALLAAAVEAEFGVLERVRNGVWAMPLGGGIEALVTLDLWKGAQASIGYGVCCSWVPYAFRGSVEIGWPNTVRQSTSHLRVDRHTLDSLEPVVVSSLDGRRRAERQAKLAVAEARELAPEWWSTVSTPAGVLIEARRQSHRFDTHRPPARVVAGFALAKLGQLADAERELVADAETRVADDPETARLRALLGHAQHRTPFR